MRQGGANIEADVSHRRREPNRYWAALAAVLALAVVVVVVVNHRHASDRRDAAQAQKVVAEHVAQMLSYDYKNVSQELASDQSWMTGGFQSTYSDLVNKQVLPAAQQTELVTKATVAGSGIVSSSHDRVQLLVFLDVTTTNNKLGQPRLTGSRVVVSAQFVDGAWRISAMKPV